MNKELLRKDLAAYLSKKKENPGEFSKDTQDRAERAAYYQSWTTERMRTMTADEFSEYLSKL